MCGEMMKRPAKFEPGVLPGLKSAKFDMLMVHLCVVVLIGPGQTGLAQPALGWAWIYNLRLFNILAVHRKHKAQPSPNEKCL